jgi:hypothetical protein
MIERQLSRTGTVLPTGSGITDPANVNAAPSA